MHIAHFFFPLFRIQSENCGSGVGSTKKEKKRERLKGQMVSMRKEENIRYEVWRNDIL